MALVRKAKVVTKRKVSGERKRTKIELGQPLYGSEIVKTGKPTQQGERTGEQTWNCEHGYHSSCSGNIIKWFTTGKRKGELKKRIDCDCKCGHIGVTKEEG